MRSNLGPIFVISGVTLLTVAAVLFLGLMLTDPPRGVLFYSSFGVVSALAMISGLLAINARLGRGRDSPSSSGASLAITFGVVTGYAVTVLVAVIIYALVRENGGHDGVFSGFLFASTACWFAAGVVLYSHDLGATKQQVVIDATNQQARTLASRLQRVRAMLNSLSISEVAQREAATQLYRRLGVLENQWSHLRPDADDTSEVMQRAGHLCTELEVFGNDLNATDVQVGVAIASMEQALSRFNSSSPVRA